MKKKFVFAMALLLCILAVSCNYGSIHATGTNTWDMGIRSGVQGHYYNYSGY